nr:hypothetical protein BaRGS_028293 [Batillaria attramentaria]
MVETSLLHTLQIDWGAGDDNGSIDFGEEIDFGIAEITVESGGQEVERIAELHAPDVAMSGNQFQGAPAIVQLNAETVEEMEGKVQGLLGQLTSVQMQHLMLIRSSPRYVDRLRDSLRQTLVNADKLVLNSKTMSSRRREALQEEQLLEPRLDALRQHTRTLQAQLEVEIAEKYKGRKVNIMGEINMI